MTARPGGTQGGIGNPAHIAVLGAGAMGTALGVHSARSGFRSVLLATDHDEAVVDAWRQRMPHPALQVPFCDHVGCRSVGEWAEVLLARTVRNRPALCWRFASNM